MLLRKRLAFGVAYGLILTIATLAGIEIVASFHAPPWPARALRVVEPTTAPTALREPFSRQPWLAEPQNAWGMRDRERTVTKPTGMVRAVFVGDSFVESRFTPQSLPAAVERGMAAAGRPIEAIDLGISATGPRSYYYRIRDVALALSPDVLLLFVYAGNDFVVPHQGYSTWPRLVDESPGGSILGWVMPRTNWLLVNRLKLAEFFRGRPSGPPAEEALIDEAVRAPDGEQLGRLVDHVRKHRAPHLSEAQIAEILSRGGGRYWRAAGPGGEEHEYLLGWMLDILMKWETSNFDVARDRQDAARHVDDGEVEATLSWIEATDRLASAHHVPLVVFLAPVGSVDPEYAAFWKPWPRAYSWAWLSDERQSRLAAALGRTKIRFVDLRQDLEGIAGTYRKLDGHWSRKGQAIVAERVERELRLQPTR
ncbi:MAG: hypothetical protein A3D94_08605 [Alphaproteobacteria bacterium RIFCSPHIGHO2_12_FULL_66_14]|nr:MAG: hypothetical protein A3D94_08605 [Alphaproteobacteria bacterium RIFCSPHIGHO2_12_FULL_66_14]